MLTFLKNLSIKRASWLLLAVSALCLELTALYFQHGMGLQPCVLCIYERVAVLGLFIAGVIGSLFPRSWLIRFSALAIGLFSSIKGLMISLYHLDLQMNPAPWKQCEVVPNFPQTLPLHQWFPFIFNPTGSCSENQWSLFGLSMVQWLVFIFAVYVLLLALILLSQLKKTVTQRRIFNS